MSGLARPDFLVEIEGIAAIGWQRGYGALGSQYRNVKVLVAQATDLHLSVDPDHPNHARFRRLLDHLLGLRPSPDALILSGDIADDGSPQAYELLRRALALWPSKLSVTLGNHDHRQHFLDVFPEFADELGFAQSVLDLGNWRTIAIDTLAEGRAGGTYDEDRASWLRRTLAKAPAVPALLILHHPPTAIGLPWLDPESNPQWAELLRQTIAPFAIAGLSSGHVHAAASFLWEGHRLTTVPAVSSDASLNFAAMDGIAPDDRPLIEVGAPGFALHRWSDGQINTFFGRCEAVITDRWDGSNERAVAAMLAEREGTAANAS